MSENTAKLHYENLLAEHYTWMFGDFDRQVEINLEWFKKHKILPQSSQKAIDLGCGSGFQSVALAALDFDVTAVDFNQTLLEELKIRDTCGVIEVIQSDILDPANYSGKAPFELVVCMGDTLPHLPSEQAAAGFLSNVRDILEPGGNLILSFRDTSAELTGVNRFIPVQQDQDKIMTVFLEYERDHIFVHDLIYKREGDTWNFQKSVYKKLRLSADNIKAHLEKESFSIHHLQSDQGMVHIIAAKRN